MNDSVMKFEVVESLLQSVRTFNNRPIDTTINQCLESNDYTYVVTTGSKKFIYLFMSGKGIVVTMPEILLPVNYCIDSLRLHGLTMVARMIWIGHFKLLHNASFCRQKLKIKVFFHLSINWNILWAITYLCCTFTFNNNPKQFYDFSKS